PSVIHLDRRHAWLAWVVLVCLRWRATVRTHGGAHSRRPAGVEYRTALRTAGTGPHGLAAQRQRRRAACPAIVAAREAVALRHRLGKFESGVGRMVWPGSGCVVVRAVECDCAGRPGVDHSTCRAPKR